MALKPKGGSLFSNKKKINYVLATYKKTGKQYNDAENLPYNKGNLGLFESHFKESTRSIFIAI
tara:strand:- start:279 stop:467 length:189 start_codon:yes stop_codon:yes gene_type:complete